MSAQNEEPLIRAAQDAGSPLLDAVQRALRGRGSGWVVLGLHLSRLAAPAPRPHHRRIASVLLNDAASRQKGQVFTLMNGDLALLYAPGDSGRDLAGALGNLFAADAPDPDLILSRWPLPHQFSELNDFIDMLPKVGSTPAKLEPEVGLTALATLFDTIDARRIRKVLERQTGVLLTVGGTERLIPLFREVRFSLPALEERAAAPGRLAADPFLIRHVAAKLGAAMMAATVADLEHDRPMLAAVRGGKTVLHVNLSLEAVLSPAFSTLVDMAERTGARVAVEIALIDAFADTEAFLRARSCIRDAKFSLVLDDVTHHALLVTKLAALGGDWLKLDWSRQILQAGNTLDAALKEIGPETVILQKADTEDAIRWGVARGIRRFQGRHTDAILAAGRLTTCSAASQCSLRECLSREQATTAAGRIGCRNQALLDNSIAGAELPP
ncbi:MAG: hypothetical protein RQ966_01280 [Acetobacteraceae bacterium]|nr:hypothetical protein [Acetobacteraceae bacterium]